MQRWFWPLIGIGVVALLAQGLSVPFWGDDYVFLLQSEQARSAGQPWWSGLWPEQPDKFWRPLSEELYWRLIAGPLGGDVTLAHGLNLLLLVLASAAVGWLCAGVVAIKWPELDARGAGAVAGLLYLIHAAHFLPLVWAAAANSSIVTLLSALALGCWVRGYGRSGGHGWLALTLVCFALALLSKEIAIVVPSLAAIISLWLWPMRVPNRSTWLAAAAAVLLGAGWLWLRQQLVVATEEAYVMGLGPHLLRNTASLGAFALNVPREALRFALTERSWLALLWGAGCALLQASALLLLAGAAIRRLRLRGVLVLVAFAVVGCGPYFLIAQRPYGYYIAVSLIAYAMLAALAIAQPRTVRLATGLALTAALLATGVSQLLPSPALLGRAHWAETQLRTVADLKAEQPDLFTPSLRVLIEDEQQFYMVGLAGVAYRLQLPLEDLLSSLSCQDIGGEPVLRFSPDHPVSFIDC